MFPSIPNKQRQGICAMGAHLDLAVHNITEALKENGLWDDTLFIFANDNGHQTEEKLYLLVLITIYIRLCSTGGPTNGDENSNNNNYPLRGGKDSLWQGGVRSLAFVRGYGIQKVTCKYPLFPPTNQTVPNKLKISYRLRSDRLPSPRQVRCDGLAAHHSLRHHWQRLVSKLDGLHPFVRILLPISYF